jgi:UDPglucose 6-dehydrogenase
MAKIAVVGSGYVGLGTGAVFADLGNQVVGVDIDAAKVARLGAGECPIFEPGLEELLARGLKSGRLRFTTDYAGAVPGADFVFICVGTPPGADGAADMRHVREAARAIGRHLRPERRVREGDGRRPDPARRTIVINKSTMPVGSGDLVRAILAEETAISGASFAVVANPEFLREGSAVRDMLHPDRIVLGSADRAAASGVAELYRALGAPVLITDLRTAEMIKYAANAFLATKISFINEVAQICEALGADVRQVAAGMGLDRRIGPQFLNAGIGFGGSCFPKDVQALAFMAEEASCHPQLLRAVLDINRDARRAFVDKLDRALGGLAGRTVAVWGLAFKPNTDDLREAPALEIIAALQARGARVRAYDPAAMGAARGLLPGVCWCADAYEAAAGADAVALLTEWNEFTGLDLARVAEQMRAPVLVDGRNLYDPRELAALGFTYRGVGLPPVEALAAAPAPTIAHAAAINLAVGDD